MTAGCPSDLVLEAFLLEPERSRVGFHLDGCASCRVRIARMQAEGDEFRRYVFPATVAAVRETAARRRPFWANLLAPAATLAAAGAAALLLLPAGPPRPPAGYVGTKGAEHVGRAGLQVFMDGADGVRGVDDGATVPAAAALRFKVKPDDGRCWHWIASVDVDEVRRVCP